MKIKFRIDNHYTGKEWEVSIIPRVGELICTEEILTEEMELKLDKSKKLDGIMVIERIIWNNENSIDIFLTKQ